MADRSVGDRDLARPRGLRYLVPPPVPSLALAALSAALGGCVSLRHAEGFTPKVSEAPPEVIHRRAEESEEAYRSPRSVEKMERSLALALDAVSPTNGYRGLWLAARACAWLAERHPDRRMRDSHAQRGIAAAREGVRLAPDRVEPRYYLALNFGRFSDLHQTGKFVKEMAENAEAAIARDERFDRAGPHRFLGILHLRTEGKLLVGFGDLAKALKHLARAVDLFPEDAENRVAYAQTLVADEDFPAARKELEAALALPAPPDLESEHAEWLKEAAELRKKIEGK
jgi:tetratricopeptide (TPR) repeat protein